MNLTHFCKDPRHRLSMGAMVAGALWFTVSTAHEGAWRQRDRVTISGAPATSVTAGQAYSFTPNATDSLGRTLVFAIAN